MAGGPSFSSVQANFFTFEALFRLLKGPMDFCYITLYCNFHYITLQHNFHFDLHNYVMLHYKIEISIMISVMS